MARTKLTPGQTRNPSKLRTKLAEHDDALDAVEAAVDAIEAGTPGAGTVTMAMLADLAGNSLIGRATNSTGVPAAITGTDGQVARVSGTSLGFGTVVAGGLATDSVTTVKIADANVTQVKLANDAVGTAQIIDANVTHAKLAANISGLGQSLSGAGAINLTTPTTYYTSTGGSQALTLADSTVVGQRKRIVHVVDGGSGVITAGGSLHLANSVATITFTNAREWAELEWNGSAWVVIGCSPVSIVA